MREVRKSVEIFDGEEIVKKIIDDELGYVYRVFVNFEKVEEIRFESEFLNDCYFDFHNGKLDRNFVEGINWDELAEHYNATIDDSGIGYDNPRRWTSKPQLRDYGYYAKIDGQEKYINVNGLGEHELVDEPDESTIWP